mmetsp:Transcript_22306/g.37314  ORF Transcript_22306/g.37314 Transcript_22306/m.37314 type:complete len:137 (+) Transcript_22306:66-476(+)
MFRSRFVSNFLRSSPRCEISRGLAGISITPTLPSCNRASAIACGKRTTILTPSIVSLQLHQQRRYFISRSFDVVANSRRNVDSKFINPSQLKLNTGKLNFLRFMSSCMKKRRMKMNKHKLKKRRKSLKMNTKQSRG